MKQELICINCPLGCALTAETETGEDGLIRVLSVSGNTCPRGADYARKELTDPTRILTSTVRVTGGEFAVVPVKTASDIPRDKIGDCMRLLRDITVCAPVRPGDVILPDAAGTGADIIATRKIEKREK